uniref:Uncharacterized protein n=1 Tax=Amphimedon queenslandica TaxID=400682 RepID=A0A1X7UFF8_AMPQE
MDLVSRILPLYWAPGCGGVLLKDGPNPPITTR